MKIVVDASVIVLITADEHYLRKALPIGQICWLGDWIAP